MKRKPLFLVFLLSLLFIVEIITIYLINSYYYLIINLSFYISLISIQAVFIFVIFNGWRTKRILTLNLYLILIIPLLFIISLPKYTYDNAKKMINNEIQMENISFESIHHKTIPVGGSHKSNSWLVSDHFYYYLVNIENKDHYFYISPFNGSVYELETDFYQYEN